MNLNISKYKKDNRSLNNMQLDFLSKNISNTLTAMELVNVSCLISISYNVLEKAIKNPRKKLSIKKVPKVKDLFKKIDLVVFDKQTNNKIKCMIMFIVYYGNFQINNNEFIGKYKKDNETYIVNVFVDKNKVRYKSGNDKINSEGVFNISPSGNSYLNITNTNLRVHRLNDKDLYKIKKVKVIETFDENKIQQFNYSQTNFDSYYIMHNTKEKVLTKPNISDNYVEKEYSWRKENGYIIKRILREYLNKDNSDSSFMTLIDIDNMLIGINEDPEASRLPNGGNFTWYDDKLDEKYKNGECSIEEIWKNKGVTYTKK